jgi:hypothetical protein
MRVLARTAAACLLCCAFWMSAGWAADSGARAQVMGLDEQIQDIKSDVLAIAAELSLLEEKLLYPSGTQVALFVSLAGDEKFRLDAVSIRLDGDEVAHYLYTFKELEALHKGAVQRIYTGNIRTGEHTLEVTVSGKSANGADYSNTIAGSINKDIGPRLVEIRLAGSGVSQPAIEIREW